MSNVINPDWTGNGLGSPAGLLYPLVGAGSRDMPVMIQFIAMPYESKTMFRDRGPDPMARRSPEPDTAPR